ncbi:MAG TPA: signal recognition particle-docking protein FtsY [Gemmatimonadota bacterium]|nr:signal recognition particle-docking protein FtsY [Gemmatimonadota bacterium]
MTAGMERELSSDRSFGPRRGLWRRIKDIALMDVAVLVRGLDAGALDELEERLLAADFGVPATSFLVAEVETEVRKGRLRTERDFREFLKRRIVDLVEAGADGGGAQGPRGRLGRAEAPPTVVLLVGVNGVGKTTTLARLAHRLKEERESVLLAAADTFRAGAIEQVEAWGDRLGIPVIAGAPGGDPAAVVYDAIGAAASRGGTYVLADTAGRLHTQKDLMEELAKVVRVAGSRQAGAPHEVLLCLDATTGQNALAQATTFADRLPVTGLVVCKLDGTARGGVVVAVRRALGVPVKFVGLGEGRDDLAVFDPEAFAEGLLR